MMMNCQKFQTWTLEYLDGLLSPEVHGECERHVARCEKCAREVSEHRRSWRLLAALPDADVDDDRLAELADRVLASAAAGGASEPQASPRPRPTATLWVRSRWLAAATVVLLAWPAARWWLNQGATPPPGSTQVAEQPASEEEIAALLADPELFEDWEVIQSLDDLEEMGEVLDLEDENVFLFEAVYLFAGM